MTKVTIVTAAYKAQEFIGNAIRAVQAQSIVDWEMLVVNDCSPDDTESVVIQYAQNDPRIRLLNLPQNSGPGAARNAGIEAANGDWIAILDADDLITPERLALLVEAGEHRHYDLIFDNIKPAGMRSPPMWTHWPAGPSAFSITEMLQGSSMITSRNYGLLKPFIRRAFLMKSGIRYEHGLRRGEDVKFHLDLMLSGASTGKISNAGYIYAIPAPDGGNASQKNLHHSHIATRMLKERWWNQLTVSQKLWLFVRLKNAQSEEAWISLRKEISSHHPAKLTSILLKSPWLIPRLILTFMFRKMGQ